MPYDRIDLFVKFSITSPKQIQMRNPTHAINWFEIPVSQFDRAKAFYSTILDITITEMQLGGDRLGLLAYDAESGGVGGAIVEGLDYVASQRGCLIYLYCGEDLNDVLGRVIAAGGRIERDKTPVSYELDMGFRAIFIDTEGNRIGLHSPQ